MHPARLFLVALTALALAACGDETGQQGGVPSPSAPSTAQPCAEVAKEGAQVTDTLIDQGCIDENGTKRVGKVTTCKNGQRLWEMNGLIGLSGKPMLAENAKGDDGVTVRLLNETACKL